LQRDVLGLARQQWTALVTHFRYGRQPITPARKMMQQNRQGKAGLCGRYTSGGFAAAIACESLHGSIQYLLVTQVTFGCVSACRYRPWPENGSRQADGRARQERAVQLHCAVT